MLHDSVVRGSLYAESGFNLGNQDIQGWIPVIKEKSTWILINFTFFQYRVELILHSLDTHSDSQESYVWYSGESNRKQYQPTRAASMMPSCAIVRQLSDREQFLEKFPIFKVGLNPNASCVLIFHLLGVYLHLFDRWIIDLAQRYLFWLNFLEWKVSSGGPGFPRRKAAFSLLCGPRIRVMGSSLMLPCGLRPLLSLPYQLPGRRKTDIRTIESS